VLKKSKDIPSRIIFSSCGTGFSQEKLERAKIASRAVLRSTVGQPLVQRGATLLVKP